MNYRQPWARVPCPGCLKNTQLTGAQAPNQSPTRLDAGQQQTPIKCEEPEISAFRYRVLHVAARITRGARQRRLRIDATWRWANAIATAWQRLRAAFP